MTTKLASPIKTRIVEDLQTLVASGVLKDVVQQDLSKDPLTNDFPGFPVAIVGMSSIESVADDNMDNLRSYTYPILVLERFDNLQSPTGMEDLRDAILNVFDTDFTLGGAAQGAIEPASSPAASASTGDKTYCYFIVTIKAKKLYTLGS